MKKMLFFKILLFFAIIGLIISFYFLFSYIYDVSKKDKLSNNIAKSYSVALLYSDNSSYSTNLNNSTIISGKDPFVIGLIKIDKIKLDYPILSNVSDELLKIAPCRFAGPLPNKIGNLCIAGHNYIDNTFFAKISRLELGDEIEIFDMNGKSIKYYVSEKKEVAGTDLSCTSQFTNGKRIVTLMTCNSLMKTRIIIVAHE